MDIIVTVIILTLQDGDQEQTDKSKVVGIDEAE